MASKKTQKEWFNDIIELAQANNRDDIVKFAEGRIEILNRKTANRSQSKKSVENEALMGKVVDTLRTIEAGTVSEIQKANAELGELSNQKVTALLRILKEGGKVTKSTESGSSIFKLAEGV